MLGHGDDAGHCSNGLSAQNYRAASAEDRAIYRRWLRRMVVFYCAILISGVFAVVSYRDAGLTRVTTLSAQPVAKSPRSN
jgi:hypothetical protein